MTAKFKMFTLQASYLFAIIKQTMHRQWSKPKSEGTNLGGGNCESTEGKLGIVFGGVGAWPPEKFWVLEALRLYFCYFTVFLQIKFLITSEINHDCSIRVSISCA